MPEPIIRRAEAGDVPTMSSLYQADGAQLSDVPAAEARWTHYLSQTPSTVADHSGQLVGFALGERMSKDLLVISNILVVADRRGDGIGAATAQHLLKEAAAEGYVMALAANSTLYSRPGKRPADTFYRKLGFQVLLTTGRTVLYSRTI